MTVIKLKKLRLNLRESLRSEVSARDSAVFSRIAIRDVVGKNSTICASCNSYRGPFSQLQA